MEPTCKWTYGILLGVPKRACQNPADLASLEDQRAVDAGIQQFYAHCRVQDARGVMMPCYICTCICTGCLDEQASNWMGEVGTPKRRTTHRSLVQHIDRMAIARSRCTVLSAAYLPINAVASPCFATIHCCIDIDRGNEAEDVALACRWLIECFALENPSLVG